MRLLPIVLLALAGCVAQPVSKPAAPAGAGEQVVTAQTVASNAEAAAKDAERERLERLRANVDAAAAAPNIEAAPVAVNELTVAQGRLSDITPDPQEQAAAAERRALVEAGRAEEARQNALAAAEAGKQAAARIRALEDEAAILRAERDKLTAELNKALAVPTLRDQFIANGWDVEPMSVDQITKVMASESERWIQLGRDMQLKAD